MKVYPTIWGGLFLIAVASTALLGPNVVAIVLFPVPVALYEARRQRGPALGLVACAALATVVSFVAWGGAPTFGDGLYAGLYDGLQAAVGLLLGLGLRRRWHHGQVVAAVAIAAFAIYLANVLLAWDAWRANTTVDIKAATEEVQASLQAQAREAEVTGPVPGVAAMEWLRENWLAIVFGAYFACLFLPVACVAVSVTTRLLRRWFGEPGVRGSFAAMRPPEWLVWVAIGLALVLFLDQKWPSAPVHVGVWNIAVGLGAVYWLNGLGVFLYGTNVLRPSLLVYLAIVVVLVSWVVPVLFFLGLFDTWADFRKRLDAAAAARQRRQQSNDET